MIIAFDQISGSIRKPGRYIEFNTRLAASGLPSGDRNLLLIGQKTDDGSKAVKIPVPVYSESDAIAYFGAGSVAHLMVKAALKANPYANISVIAPAEAEGSAAAAGTITLTGPATSSGLLTVRIGNVTLELAIASADTAAGIATALKALLDNNPALPVKATKADGVVTLTAKNKGTLGNTIIVSAEVDAPGVTAVATALAGGLVDPDITDALVAVRAMRYNRIVSSVNSSTAAGKLKDHMELVSGPMEERPGIGIVAFIGDLDDGQTLAANYTTTGRMFIAYNRGIKELSWEFAAKEGAVHISESDPARPLNGLVLAGTDAPEISDRLTRTEQEACLASGLTPHEVDAAGNVTIVRAITTYTKNAAGVADIALLDVTTVDTLDWLRDAAVNRMALRFPRAKMTAKDSVRTELYSMLKDAEALEIIQDVDAHADELKVEPREGTPGRLDCVIPAAVVPGLHVFAARIDLIL